MDQVIEGFGKVLIDMGATGLAIGVLLGVCYMLFKSNEDKTKIIISLTESTVKANETTTASLVRLNDLLASSGRITNNGGT